MGVHLEAFSISRELGSLSVLTRLLSWVTRFAPLSSVRLMALRAMPGVSVGRNVQIGWGCRFQADRIEVGNGVRIGRFNRFVGPMSVFIGANCQIATRNRFSCAEWLRAERYDVEGYARTIRIGDDCLITEDHMFDCAGLVVLGDGTWVAGRGSQIWTHGVGVAKRDVIIGQRCYLGSAVRLAPGARLGDECILSLGSVLSGDLSDARCAMVAGVPAKIVKQLEADYASGRIERHGRNW